MQTTLKTLCILRASMLLKADILRRNTMLLVRALTAAALLDLGSHETRLEDSSLIPL